jgi:hypothetical protein
MQIYNLACLLYIRATACVSMNPVARVKIWCLIITHIRSSGGKDMKVKNAAGQNG